jgi:hypothetical protein
MNRSDYVTALGLILWFIGLADSYTIKSDAALIFVTMGIFAFAMGVGMRVRGL